MKIELWVVTATKENEKYYLSLDNNEWKCCEEIADMDVYTTNKEEAIEICNNVKEDDGYIYNVEFTGLYQED